MNYNKIQEILQSDAKFAPLVDVRDTCVVGPNGERNVYAALTVQVAKEIAARGISYKNIQKIMVLALAATLCKDATPPMQQSPIQKPVDNPVPPEKVPVPEKVERVVVTPLSATDTPVKAEARQQSAKLDKFVESNQIIKYQSAIAITQLLASIFQLSDNDNWPGHERRKALLNELLESYEEMSRNHVNLSVKQLIRAQIESQISSGR